MSGTSGGDVGYSVSMDHTGGFLYLSGQAGASLHGESYEGGNDILLMKYASNGTRVWTKMVGTSGSDIGYEVAVDSNTGAVFVIGEASGSLHGQTNVGQNDILVMEFSSNGTRVWTRMVGTTTQDLARSASVDASIGAVYVAGQVSGAINGETFQGGSRLLAMLDLFRCRSIKAAFRSLRSSPSVRKFLGVPNLGPLSSNRDDIVASSHALGNHQLLLEASSLDIPLLDFYPAQSFRRIAFRSIALGDNNLFGFKGCDVPLFFMVRGKGGGKTRALQEVCFEALLHQHNCLAVGVTFGSGNELLELDIDAWNALMKGAATGAANDAARCLRGDSRKDNVQANDLLMFGVCCRMLSSFYDVDYSIARTTLKDILIALPSWTGELLVFTVFNHMLFHTRKFRPIDKWLLLIDDPSNAAHYAMTGKEIGTKDPFHKLSNIVISFEICNMIDIRPMMLIASKEVLPAMVYPDRRRLKQAIDLPETLDSEAAAKILVHRLASANVQHCTESELELWAALFSDAPRTLDFALRAIPIAADIVRNGDSSVAFDSAFTAAWLKEIRQLCQKYYDGGVEDSLLQPIILSKERVSILEDPARGSIENSMLTNSLKEKGMPFEWRKGSTLSVTPIASAFLLWVRLTRDSENLLAQQNSGLLRELRSFLIKIMECMEKREYMTRLGESDGNLKMAGSIQLQRDLLFGIIRLRLLAFAAANTASSESISSSSRKPFAPNVSVEDLFAFDKVSDAYGYRRHVNARYVNFDLSELAKSQNVDSFTCNIKALSYKNLKRDFIDEMERVVVSRERQFKLLKFHDQERAGGGMLVYRNEAETPLLVLWDCAASCLPHYGGGGDWNHARYWCIKFPSQAPLVKAAAAGIVKKKGYSQSALRALAESNVLFIYVDSSTKMRVDWYSRSRILMVDSGCGGLSSPSAIRLGSGSIQKLLAFCSPLYNAATSL
eukprot:gene25911-31290_t